MTTRLPAEPATRRALPALCLLLATVAAIAPAQGGLAEFPTPDAVVLEAASDFHGRAIIGPIPTRRADLLGHALKVVIANDLEGLAFTSYRVPGMTRDALTVPGVLTPRDDFERRLRRVRFKQVLDGDEKLFVSVRGKTVVTAADLFRFTNAYDVMNPDLVIARLEPGVQFDIELVMTRGYGVRTAEENDGPHLAPSDIPIASRFNPIVSVTLVTEPVAATPGASTLTLDIVTDGTTPPDLAYLDAADALAATFGAPVAASP